MKRNIEKYKQHAAYITEHFGYNPQTGIIFWIKRPRNSSVIIGGEAGTTQNGYKFINVKHARLYSHHVAWFLHYGQWAPDEIDHRDNNPLNNKLFNMRAATREQQTHNVRAYKKQGKGLKGAFKAKGENRWFGQIRVKGRQIYLGRFHTEEAAHAAYVAAARAHFGEFARAA